MASYTPNLNLLKKDPVADGNDFFNIKTMLNDNWDKIDESVKAALDDIGDLQSEQVWIATGSYVGTGTYGASNPCSLTFPFVPKLYGVISYRNGSDAGVYIETPICPAEDLTTSFREAVVPVASTSTSGFGKISGDRKTVSWYTTETINGALAQSNDKGRIYWWYAIG